MVVEKLILTQLEAKIKIINYLHQRCSAQGYNKLVTNNTKRIAKSGYKDKQNTTYYRWNQHNLLFNHKTKKKQIHHTRFQTLATKNKQNTHTRNQHHANNYLQTFFFVSHSIQITHTIRYFISFHLHFKCISISIQTKNQKPKLKLLETFFRWFIFLNFFQFPLEPPRFSRRLHIFTILRRT